MRNLKGMRAFGLVVAFGLLAACTSAGPRPAAVRAAPAIDSLVTTEWLSQHLNDSDLVILDCTVRVQRGEEGGFKALSGREEFEKGHIPKAGFADLIHDLADDTSSLGFAVPSPEKFAAAMAALGVRDDARVVLYSATEPSWPARVWWMLRWIGFDRAALLDGGLKAWTAEGRPLSTEAPNRPAGRLTVALRPGLIADRDEVRAAVDDGKVTIVDSLPPASYEGKFSLYKRPGHITGAVNMPVTALLDEAGRFLPAEQLAAMLSVERKSRVITYCGGDIAASEDAFVLTRLGYANVAVYAASLQEWAADPTNPMTVGPNPREAPTQE